MSTSLDSKIPVWRCLRAKPKHEHLASKQLRQLGAGAIETFCPRLRHRKATARGLVWFVEALFPGYLFARAEWPQWQRLALAAPGVTGQVHFGDFVPEVPEASILSLKEAFPPEEAALTIVTSELIAAGDEVEIASGPLRGMSGMVTRLLPARERIAVLLEFLGSTREVEVPLLDVLGLQDARQAAFS